MPSPMLGSRVVPTISSDSISYVVSWLPWVLTHTACARRIGRGRIVGSKMCGRWGVDESSCSIDVHDSFMLDGGRNGSCRVDLQITAIEWLGIQAQAWTIPVSFHPQTLGGLVGSRRTETTCPVCLGHTRSILASTEPVLLFPPFLNLSLTPSIPRHHPVLTSS